MCALELQVCVWTRDDWERKANRFLSSPQGRVADTQANTYVQFNQDQTHVLAIHETQIALYDASTLDCIKQVHACHIMIHVSISRF